MASFEKYDVKVISDEIWSDLILKGQLHVPPQSVSEVHQDIPPQSVSEDARQIALQGVSEDARQIALQGVSEEARQIASQSVSDAQRHIPSQSVSEDARQRTVALYAPSKTFNLAGLIGSYHIIYNETLRDRIRKESSLSHYNSMNVLSMHALIGAYSTEGEEWLEELLQVLSENVLYAVRFIREHLEGVSVAVPEGTYMLFLDCTGWCRAHDCALKELEHRLWRKVVAVQDGAMFHGPCHLRMNLALPHAKVIEAMERMRDVFAGV